MSLPTVYTEKTLAVYMLDMLGKVGRILGLLPGEESAGDFAEAVNDALLAYGATDISLITGTENLMKLRAHAKVAAWQYVTNNFAALYDFSADGGSYSRSQLFDQAKQSLEMAENLALPYLTNYTARVRKMDHIHDPYQVRDIEDRTL